MKTWSKIRKPAIIGVLVLLALSYYFYLTHRDDKKEKPVQQTELSPYTERDMEHNYPSLPKQVVQFFVDIQKIWYKQDISDEDFSKLVNNVRATFDPELLALNDLTSYTERLTEEIASYKAADKYILEYQIDTPTLKLLEEREYAIVPVRYYLIANGKPLTINQEFVLRKNTDNEWKILYWARTDEPAGGE